MNEMQKIDGIQKEIPKLVAQAEKVSIATREDYEVAIEEGRRIKGIWTSWTEYWQPLKEKAYSVHREVTQKEKQGTDILKKAYDIIKGKILSYQQEQNRKAEEEQRRLQAIAEEKARRERERFEKRAEELKTPEKKAEAQEQAEQVITPVIKVEADIQIKGVSTKTVWKAELLDMKELILSAIDNPTAFTFLSFDGRIANAFASATKGMVPVAGVRFVGIKILNIREGENGE